MDLSESPPITIIHRPLKRTDFNKYIFFPHIDSRDKVAQLLWQTKSFECSESESKNRTWKTALE